MILRVITGFDSASGPIPGNVEHWGAQTDGEVCPESMRHGCVCVHAADLSQACTCATLYPVGCTEKNVTPDDLSHFSAIALWLQKGGWREGE